MVKMRVSVGRTFAAAFKKDICRRGDNRGTCVVGLDGSWDRRGLPDPENCAIIFGCNSYAKFANAPLVRRHYLWPVAALPARLFQLISPSTCVTPVRPTHLWQGLKGRRSLVVSGFQWSLFILRMFQDSVLGS